MFRELLLCIRVCVCVCVFVSNGQRLVGRVCKWSSALEFPSFPQICIMSRDPAPSLPSKDDHWRNTRPLRKNIECAFFLYSSSFPLPRGSSPCQCVVSADYLSLQGHQIIQRLSLCDGQVSKGRDCLEHSDLLS